MRRLDEKSSNVAIDADQIVGIYGPIIRRQLKRLRVRSADIPDLCQDILITALSQMSKGLFEERAAFSTWLHCIIRGRTMDYWRKIFSQERMVKEIPIGERPAVARYWTGPELRATIYELLATWPAHHRTAFEAFYLCGEPVESIANRIRRSTSLTREILTTTKQAIIAAAERR